MKKCILIFGTFNPITNAHISLGLLAKALYKDSDIYFVIAKTSFLQDWKHYDNKDILSEDARLKLCKEAVVDKDEPWNNTPAYDTFEMRYCIVSTDTGEVLDDAQGYGYKTAQKAYSAYAYKTRDKSKDKKKQEKKRHIQQWMKEHKSFVKAMDDTAFEIAKGTWGYNDKFDASLVKEMLSNFELEPDFTASELLKAWRDR